MNTVVTASIPRISPLEPAIPVATASDPLLSAVTQIAARMQASAAQAADDQRTMSAVHAIVAPHAGSVPPVPPVVVTPASVMTGFGALLGKLSRNVPLFLLACWSFGWTPATFNPSHHSYPVPHLSCEWHVPGPTPGPGPGPNPVPPTPVPPTPSGPLRVILVADTSANMNQGQLDAVNSTAVRTWLNAKCTKDADGRPAWRSWDPTIDASGETKVWQDAWTAAKPMLTTVPPPMVVVFVGQTGKAAPMPASEADLLTLLKSYGGN